MKNQFPGGIINGKSQSYFRREANVKEISLMISSQEISPLIDQSPFHPRAGVMRATSI